MRQIAFATIFLATLFGLGPDTVSGQSIRINVEGAPLEDVLSALRTTSSIDVVYAGSLVEGVESSCMYEGDDPAEALLCVLEGERITGTFEQSDSLEAILDVVAAALDASIDRTDTGFRLRAR